MTASDARRSANGSFDPVGTCPIPKMPIKVSSLSAKASAADSGDWGNWSPENFGQ